MEMEGGGTVPMRGWAAGVGLYDAGVGVSERRGHAHSVMRESGLHWTILAHCTQPIKA